MNIEVAPGITLAGPGDWQRRTHVEAVWGTHVTFDIRQPQIDPVHVEAVIGQAVGFLHQVDDWFSTWRVDTPMTLYRNGVLDATQLPAVIRDVLSDCQRLRTRTLGAFDPWAVAGGVDPSGYVKGWAAARVADMFQAAGYPNVCIDASGDLDCRGQQAPDQPWAVGIINPYDPRTVIKVVHVTDMAVATSGLYERGAHVLNPRTGHSDVALDSATIIGPDAGQADALATAALVAGLDCLTWFADLPGWSGYLVKDQQASFFGPAFTI